MPVADSEVRPFVVNALLGLRGVVTWTGEDGEVNDRAALMLDFRN